MYSNMSFVKNQDVPRFDYTKSYDQKKRKETKSLLSEIGL